jgi:integrase
MATQTVEEPKGDSIYAYETKQGTRYRFAYRDAAGKQSQRRGFTSRTAARKERQRLMGGVHRGEVRISRERFGVFWERWLVKRKPYLEEGSWRDYEIHGRKRILPRFEDERLTAITSPMVEDWIVELASNGDYKPKTLNNALKTLVVCLNHAVREGLIAANPASFVPALPPDHVERDYLRLNEINAYLDGCTERYRPLAETLLGTGMRISEALALTIEDVHLDKGAIVVYRSAKGQGRVGATKGKRFRRVEIGPKLIATLTDLIATRGKDRSALLFVMPRRVERHDQGSWARREGEPIDRSLVSVGWHKAALEDAGLRDMPLHALRHTAAAAWLSTGHPLFYVQRQLGHAQITTTERIYAHLEETFMRSAAAETEAAIERAGGLFAEE